jgi:type I restriction enzyme S subunit
MKKVPLTRVCDFQGGTQPPKEEWEINYKPGYIRMLQIRDFTRKKESHIEYVRISNKLKTCNANDILIGRYGASIGKILTGLEGAYNVAMIKTIPDETTLSKPYLYYILKNESFQSFISNIGSRAAQAGFNKEDLSKFQISLPSLDDQIRIATVLTRAEKLIAKRKESIKALDELLKSIFLEMFGDPVRNEKGWDKKELKLFGKIITGNTPPRNDSDNYSSNFIEWIKTDNIVANKTYLTVATEYLSEKGLAKARIVTSGSLLVACIAGSIESIGRAAIANRQVSFNQQINAIQPNEKTNSLFLYWLFKISKLYIQSYATKGMKKILTKGDFERITMVCPPLTLQNQFGVIVEKVELLKEKCIQSLTELENLYGSLGQRAFNGELNLGKVPVKKEEQVTELCEDGMVTLSIEEKLSVSKIYSEAELLKIIQSLSEGNFSFDSLVVEFQKASFKELPKYEELKKQIYKMLEGADPLLSQTFDKVKKEIALRVNI